MGDRVFSPWIFGEWELTFIFGRLVDGVSSTRYGVVFVGVGHGVGISLGQFTGVSNAGRRLIARLADLATGFLGGIVVLQVDFTLGFLALVLGLVFDGGGLLGGRLLGGFGRAQLRGLAGGRGCSSGQLLCGGGFRLLAALGGGRGFLGGGLAAGGWGGSHLP